MRGLREALLAHSDVCLGDVIAECQPEDPYIKLECIGRETKHYAGEVDCGWSEYVELR